MKKTKRLVPTACIAMLLLGAAVQAADMAGFRVTEHHGTALVKPEGSMAFAAPDPTRIYPWNAEFLTEDRSGMTLELAPGSSVSLEPDTHLRVLKRERDGAADILFSLHRGRIDLSTAGLPDGCALLVSTPLGVCKAVGTVFTVGYAELENGAQELLLICRDGRVLLEAREMAELIEIFGGSELVYSAWGHGIFRILTVKIIGQDIALALRGGTDRGGVVVKVLEGFADVLEQILTQESPAVFLDGTEVFFSEVAVEYFRLADREAALLARLDDPDLSEAERAAATEDLRVLQQRLGESVAGVHRITRIRNGSIVKIVMLNPETRPEVRTQPGIEGSRPYLPARLYEVPQSPSGI